MDVEVQASAPEVERDGERITISFSVGQQPVSLNFSEGQARRIARELLEALNETH
jgi:hypothetical protein